MSEQSAALWYQASIYVPFNAAGLTFKAECFFATGKLTSTEIPAAITDMNNAKRFNDDQALMLGRFFIGINEVDVMLLAVKADLTGIRVSNRWVEKSLSDRCKSIKADIQDKLKTPQFAKLDHLAQLLLLIEVRNTLAHSTLIIDTETPFEGNGAEQLAFGSAKSGPLTVYAKQLQGFAADALTLSDDLSRYLGVYKKPGELADSVD